MKKKVLNKLLVTKRSVSREWKKYRTKKSKILKSKRLPLEFKEELIYEARLTAKQNISIKYEDYRGFKYGLVHHSPFPDFKLSKIHRTIGTKQEYYTAKRNYDYDKLDNQFKKLFEKSDVRGITLIFKVYDEETDQLHYVSDHITRGLFNRLQEKNVSLFEHLSMKLKYSRSVHEYELKNISMRIIYEKSKKVI